MEILSNFIKLEFQYKSIIISILFLSQLFFISIYLFDNELIQRIGENALSDIDFYFILLVCISLSCFWFTANLIIVYVSMLIKNLSNAPKSMDEAKNNAYKAINDKDVFAFGTITSFFSLCGVIFIGYFFYTYIHVFDIVVFILVLTIVALSSRLYLEMKYTNKRNKLIKQISLAQQQ